MATKNEIVVTAKDTLDAVELDNSLDNPSDTINKYDRFTRNQKRLYLFIVTVACFLSPISTTMFLPAVPEIAAQFHTTGTTINISNAVYCVVMAISPLIVGTLCKSYGKRYMSLVCSLGYSIASYVVSQSQNLTMFFIFRAFMAIFGTAYFSIGSMIVADIYIPEERGTASGLLMLGAQAGLAIAAVFGGIITHYSKWNTIFLLLGSMGAFVFILSFMFLKETSVTVELFEYRKETGKKFKFFTFNPFRPVILTRFLPVFLSCFAPGVILYNMFCLLVPITYVIKGNLHIESTILISLFYLAPGTGFVIGSILGGWYSDYTVRKFKKMRGRRIPEDRLSASLIFLGFFSPISILIYGWSLEKDLGGIALPVIMMFINGISQCMAIPNVNSYSIDASPQIAPDWIANSFFLRFLFSAVANGTVLVQINTIGIGWTCTITAFILWLGFTTTGILFLWGEKLRNRLFPQFQDQ